MTSVAAVTLDFYETLVRHRTGVGRGRSLMSYLEAEGLVSEPWEHRVLYDVLEPHAREYDPRASPAERERYCRRLARRLFERLRVDAPPEEADRRAHDVWALLGPASLAVYPDVPDALAALRAAGLRLAVASNWQCGLGHFCVELGLAKHFEHVVASAEVGSEKPDAGIFLEACRLLAVEPERALHVGDSPVADIEGARAAGLRAILIDRTGDDPHPGVTVVSSLAQVAALV